MENITDEKDSGSNVADSDSRSGSCGAGISMVVFRKWKTIKAVFRNHEEVFGNPLMGYAPNAWHEEVAEDISLLYMDITWAELEPEEGIYGWTSIEEENQIAQVEKRRKASDPCDLSVTFRVMRNIWISPGGCMRRPEKRTPGMMVNMEKDIAPDYNNKVFIDEPCRRR